MIGDEYAQKLTHYRSEIDAAIDRLVPSNKVPSKRVHEAMRYSLFAGGKRLRPLLVLAGHALSPSEADPLPASVAIECVHTYSLIHDDLPCMDNSELRRGQPTCHKAFGEATALLVGDALLALAFEILAEHYQKWPQACIQSIRELSIASGRQKLIAGQIEDLLAEDTNPHSDQLFFIHENKTAAMIIASLVIGVQLSNASTEMMPTIRRIGYSLGMAFQIKDDLLDASSTTTALGKDAGQDEKNKKLTAVKLMGTTAATQHMEQAFEDAQLLIKQLSGDTTLLTGIVERIHQRTY